MPAQEIQVNSDGDVVAYDGRVLEVFFLDGSKRFVASRLRVDRGEPDHGGAVLVQLWATPAQMVAMVRVEFWAGGSSRRIARGDQRVRWGVSTSRVSSPGFRRRRRRVRPG